MFRRKYRDIINLTSSKNSVYIYLLNLLLYIYYNHTNTYNNLIKRRKPKKIRRGNNDIF
jgi:hypothetical protein